MKTVNKSFNDAWEILKEYHQEGNWFPDMIALDLSNRPKFKTRAKKKKRGSHNPDSEWMFYLKSLQAIITIGKRNNWIHVHVDGQGYPVYLCVPNEFNKEDKMKEKEIKALRDKVIDYVYQENSVTAEEIAHEMLIGREQTKEILDALVKENLISNFEDEYYPLG